MVPLGTNRLLSSIVEITEQRDCSRFRASLCKTIRELTPVIGIAFVRPLRKTRMDGGVPNAYETVHQDPPTTHYNTPLYGALDTVSDALSPAHVLEMMHAGHALTMDARHATLLLPILHYDHLAEILVVRAETLTQNDLFLLRTFARLYRNFLSLINESERDALTGLYNRRVLEERLAAVLNTTEKHTPLARRSDAESAYPPALHPYLAVFDIDKFKRINDTLGHLFGDEIILLVANLMKELFRGHDALFRYGGDEFVVILMAENSAGARKALERFRERVAEHRFPQIERVTTSIGFVEIRAGELPASVIGQADQALYQSKRRGRNCVSDYDEVLAHGDAHKPLEHSEAELF